MKKNLVETFLDLVAIYSPSRNERYVADYIIGRLAKLPVHIIEDDTYKSIKGNCGNIIVKLDGIGQELVFDAHMDCVESCKDVEAIHCDGVIKSNGNTILGADDKVGVASMICLLENLAEDGLPHPPITCVFSVCEEDGLQGVKHLDMSYIKEDAYIYVLDGEGAIASIVNKTPSGCKGTIKVNGKEAHAGVCPQEGINALVVASDAISKLTIGRIHEGLTCNIGKITGGSARNVVMGEVMMEFEARGYEKQEVETLLHTIRSTFHESCQKYNTTFEDDIRFGTPGYILSEEDGIVSTFIKICECNGFIFQEEACGGGSNANVYRMRGRHALCLGTNMKQVHSCEEHIALKDIQSLYKLLQDIVRFFTIN